MNYPLIQCNGGIYVLAKAGKYAGKYLGFDDGDVYKLINGEYSAVKKVKVDILPDNMARTEEEGYILKLGIIQDFNPNGTNSIT